MGDRFFYRPTLEGFFTMLDRLSTHADVIEAVEPLRSNAQNDLFFESAYIDEDSVRAEEMLRRLKRSGGKSVEELSRAFLSGRSIALSALAYCRHALAGKYAKLDDETDPDIGAIKAASRAVEKELHRFEGMLRFSPRADGAYVAEFEPDTDILESLLPFFVTRFGETPFMVVDRKRGKAGGTASDGVIDSEDLVDVISSEGSAVRGDDEEESLWRVFYKATENPARKNPGLRRQFMPLRYWKYLHELRDEIP